MGNKICGCSHQHRASKIDSGTNEHPGAVPFAKPNPTLIANGEFIPPTWDQYWAGSVDLLQKLWPAAASYAVQSYEFSLYELAIHEIKANFFSGSSEVAWLCYAMPFFTRPLGGMGSGWLSDRYGRRLAVIAVSYSVLITTVFQGLVPANTGNLGALCLAILRLFQGLAFGATSSFAVYAAEVAPRQFISQGLMMLSLGGTFGGIASTFIFGTLSANLTSDQMASWGWRVPFLLVFIPGLLSAMHAHSLEESPDFVERQESVGQDEKPSFADSLTTLFSSYGLNMMLCAGVLMASPAVLYVSRTYIIEWLPQYTNVSKDVTFWLVEVNNAACLLCHPIMAYLGDSYGPTKVLLTGYSVNAAMSIPLFAMLLYGKNTCVSAVALQLIYGTACSLALPSGLLAVGLLPTTVRNMSTGLIVNGVTCTFGGLSPAFLSWLSGYNALAPAFYTTAVQACTLVAIAITLQCHQKGAKMSYLREEPF